MKKSDIPLIKSLINSMSENMDNLEDAFENDDEVKFERFKKMITLNQQKVLEAMK
jgi:hypothetical protein